MDAGKRTSHVTVSLKWKNERGMDQLPSLLRAAGRANALGIPTNTVKFYVDGVIPQKTAYMLAPYQNSDERGAPQIAPEVLKQAMVANDRTEEQCGGKEGESKGRSRWWEYP